MTIRVTPTITIDGRTVACTADRVDVEPVAVRNVAFTWGRSEYHDADTEPSDATLYLTDSTGEWARRIRESQAVGRPVVVSWTGIPTTPGGIVVGPVTMFRGRITRARAEPQGTDSPDGRRRWLITLTCADRTADMGNATAGPEEWPAETMLARAVKIRDLGTAAGSGITDVFFWPGYMGAGTWPLDVKDTSALDLMGAFYRSMGNDSWSYDPHANVVRQAIRLSQPYTVHLGAFDDNLGAVLPVPSDIVVDQVTYPGVALGGCELIGTPHVEADPATDINRLECSWKDNHREYGDVVTVKENVAPGDSRRVMAWETWLNDGIAVDPTLDNVWNRVREEGRRPRHPDITTRHQHEFVTGRMARWLLQTWENTRPAYIAGSLAYQWLMADTPGYAPVVAPIGGTTTYDPVLGWSTTMHVHWLHNQTPAASPATWTSLMQTRTTWSTTTVPWWWAALGLPVPPPVAVGARTPERDLTWGAVAAEAGYRFADSVTWGDMRHVPVSQSQIIDHLE